MADSKISQLPAYTGGTGLDEIPIANLTTQTTEQIPLNTIFDGGGAVFTYNANGTVNTAQDTFTGYTYTFAYNSDSSIHTINNTINTWTFSYNADGTVSTIVKS